MPVPPLFGLIVVPFHTPAVISVPCIFILVFRFNVLVALLVTPNKYNSLVVSIEVVTSPAQVPLVSNVPSVALIVPSVFCVILEIH
jgi:hypothetical protein